MTKLYNIFTRSRLDIHRITDLCNAMHSRIIYGALLLLFLFTSCEKKEKPITLPAKGDGNVMQVDMGTDYDYQFYINLEQQRIVKVSEVQTWDIAFESGLTQYHVFLNGAKSVAAFNTNKTNFADVGYNDTLQAKTQWAFDSPIGSADSTAIGDWKISKPIYILRLNESGSKLRKFQILSEDQFQYQIAVGDIGSTTPAYLTVVKNFNQNFTYFSFDFLNTIQNIEPDKSTWDIVITRYHHTFYDQSPALPYQVNGILLNPTNTSAYKDSLLEYSSIDKNIALSMPLSSYRDVIGFDWKTYDIDKGIYTIVKKYNYIIKTQNDIYYKLHFLDFYNSAGVKGSPKFEFTRLP